MGAKVPVVPLGKGGAVAKGPASPVVMTCGRAAVELLLLLWLASGSRRVPMGQVVKGHLAVC